MLTNKYKRIDEVGKSFINAMPLLRQFNKGTGYIQSYKVLMYKLIINYKREIVIRQWRNLADKLSKWFLETF